MPLSSCCPSPGSTGTWCVNGPHCWPGSGSSPWRRTGLLLRLDLPHPRRGRSPRRIPGARAGPRLGALRTAQARHPGRRGRCGAGRRRTRLCRGGLGRSELRRRGAAARTRGGVLPGGLLRPVRPGQPGRRGRGFRGRRAAASGRRDRLRTAGRRSRPHGRGPAVGHGLDGTRRERGHERAPGPRVAAARLDRPPRDRARLCHRSGVRTAALTSGGGCRRLPGSGHRHRARLGTARRTPLHAPARGRLHRADRGVHRPVVRAQAAVRPGGFRPGNPGTPAGGCGGRRRVRRRRGGCPGVRPDRRVAIMQRTVLPPPAA